MDDETTPELKKNNNLAGIGGWLILVALGMIVGPLFLLNTVIELLSIISDPDTSLFLSDYPFARTLIFAEIIINTAFVFLFILTAYYFFKKDSRLPKIYIVLLGSFAIFTLLDYLMAINAYGTADYSGFENVVRSFLQAAIWITYFKKSERVKLTFN